MPVLDAPSAKEQVEDRHPVPGRMIETRPRRGRNDSAEVLQHCLDLAVTGNQAASRVIHRFAEAVDQAAHAPFDFGRALVHSAVLVDVDVDVDIASQQQIVQEPDQEGSHDRNDRQ